MIRLRFAPSPTGYLHVGGARTALFNWLFARRHGGVFVLRIEDTDAERSSDEMVAGILQGLRWLGLDWDEGPEIGGPDAPYFQSQRFDRHRDAANTLVARGHAYYDFTPPEEYEQARKEAEARGEVWRYERARWMQPAERQAELAATGAPRAVRFLVPPGRTSFADLVHGPVEFDNSHIEDFVILRSDGLPTYHLSVVCDDIDMRITHVVRGDDHVSNTPKHVLLFEGLGRRSAAVRARAAHPGPRQEAPEQAARRDLGHGIRAPGLPARDDGELPGAARLVAGRRSRAVLQGGARPAVLAGRHRRPPTRSSTPRSSSG